MKKLAILASAIAFFGIGAAANAADDARVETQMEDSSAVTPKKWGVTSDISFYAAHICPASATLSECRQPTTLADQPTLYFRFWSPASQNYVVFWSVTDAASGSVVYLDDDVIAATGCSNCVWSFRKIASAIQALPTGAYTFTAAITGLSNSRWGVTNQFTFWTYN